MKASASQIGFRQLLAGMPASIPLAGDATYAEALQLIPDPKTLAN